MLDIIRETRKRFLKSLAEGIEILLKKKKTESENMVANDIKMQKNKNLL